MTLLDRQRSFRGVIFGGPGVPYRIVSESGLEDRATRNGDRPIPREDGSIPGLDVADSRMVVLRLRVMGSAAEVEQHLAALEAVTAPSRSQQFQYRFKSPGRPERFVWARPDRFGRPRTVDTEGAGLVECQLGLRLADPRIYSVAQFSTTVPVFNAGGGGAAFPGEFPFTMSVSVPDLAVLVNAGSRDAYPLLQFQHESGTVSGVTLTNLTTGVVFESSASIVDGQTLTADMDALVRATGSSVVHIGGSSRYGTWALPRDPFYLAPGSNTLRFEVSGGGEATCLVSWRSTD